jgi:hypothetical protein
MSRALAIGGTVSPVLMAAMGGGTPRPATPAAPAMARPGLRIAAPGMSAAYYSADLTGLGAPGGMMPSLTGLPNTGMPATAASAVAQQGSSPMAQLLAGIFGGGGQPA